MTAVSSKSDVHVPDDIVRFVRAVLLSSDRGVLLRDFCADYVKLVGTQLPYKQLGFSTCEEMLMSIPEAVTIVKTEQNGQLQLKLYGRGDGVSFMTSAAKKAQQPRVNEEIVSGCTVKGATNERKQKPMKNCSVKNGCGSSVHLTSPVILQRRLQELKKRQSELNSTLRSVKMRCVDDSDLMADRNVSSKKIIEQRIEILKTTVARQKAELQRARKETSHLRAKMRL
ncbi:uncharacterized protein LOC134195074 isoform X2 [Corticium candelabrum]|uniref:uncharacterized protein LOC134195074 isoform X2 n=1 Tax=Corticium candelabrum TaxID=121492 RepID=UPI002E2598EC|nr:uncharacterized protein LOC134195074 isoform X2 [Corticium candelabrum]